MAMLHARKKYLCMNMTCVKCLWYACSDRFGSLYLEIIKHLVSTSTQCTRWQNGSSSFHVKIEPSNFQPSPQLIENGLIVQKSQSWTTRIPDQMLSSVLIKQAGVWKVQLSGGVNKHLLGWMMAHAFSRSIGGGTFDDRSLNVHEYHQLQSETSEAELKRQWVLGTAHTHLESAIKTCWP